MRFLTAAQAAARCGVCHGTFCRWLTEGRVTGAVRIGRAWEVPKDFKVVLPYHPKTLRRAVGEKAKDDAA
jgi:hypothetical protein